MPSHVSLLIFKFDNFESLPYYPGSRTVSEELIDDNNNKWRLVLFPGGAPFRPFEEDRKERPMELYLQNVRQTDTIVLGIILRNGRGDVVAEECVRDLSRHWDWRMKLWGGESYMTRSDILDEAKCILRNGALHIECLIQLTQTVDFEIPHTKGHFYLPPNPVATDMVDFVTRGNRCDVSIAIGNEVFHLHKHVVTAHAPILANMFDGENTDESIQLSGMTAEVFRIVLRYIYSGVLPKAKIVRKLGHKIIHAADYLGIESLKMVAETAMVASRFIRLENVVYFFLFADAKTCPLLKEYALAYIIARPRDVLKSKSYAQLKECSGLKDEIILAAIDNGERSLLTVDELRRKLSRKGLDVYGSKKVLVSRLDEHSSKVKM